MHRHGLVGARIGVARAGYAGFDDEVDQLFESAIADMRVAGAVIIDPADLPSAEEMHDKRDQENVVMLYEFKHDVAAYLATRKPGPGGQMPPRSLADLIAFNIDHHELELAYFGQDLFEQAESSWPEDEYRAALADNIRMARRDGIDAVIEEHRLDALVAPSGGPAWPTGLGVPDTWTGGASSAEAMAGYPVVTVPMGFIGLLPVGVSFFGTAWSEATLLRCAFAYEQATLHRRAPRVTA